MPTGIPNGNGLQRTFQADVLRRIFKTEDDWQAFVRSYHGARKATAMRSRQASLQNPLSVDELSSLHAYFDNIDVPVSKLAAERGTTQSKYLGLVYSGALKVLYLNRDMLNVPAR